MITCMKKRVVAFLLAFAMVLTMVPNTVQAASNSTTAKKAVGKTNPNGVMDIPFYKTELFKDKTFYKIVSSHRVEYGVGYGYAKDAQEYAKYLQKKITTASGIYQLCEGWLVHEQYAGAAGGMWIWCVL